MGFNSGFKGLKYVTLSILVLYASKGWIPHKLKNDPLSSVGESLIRVQNTTFKTLQSSNKHGTEIQVVPIAGTSWTARRLLTFQEALFSLELTGIWNSGSQDRVSRWTVVTTVMNEFVVITALISNVAVSWRVTSCSLVDNYRRFRRTCCLNDQGRWCKLQVSLKLSVLTYHTREGSNFDNDDPSVLTEMDNFLTR